MHKALSLKAFAVAMTLVLSLGLIFFVGLHFYLQKSGAITPAILQGPVTDKPVSLTLNLSDPDDNKLVFNSELLIQGQTASGATVILSSEAQDMILEPNNKGSFSATTKLQPGLNLLTVTVFDSSGNSKSENRTVYYSQEKI